MFGGRLAMEDMGTPSNSPCDAGVLARLEVFNRVHDQPARLAEHRFFELASKATTAQKRLVWLRRAAGTVGASMETSGISACKPGCSHCCRIAVQISDVEARALALSSGRRMNPNPEHSLVLNMETIDTFQAENRDEAVDRYFGVPCPFLLDNKCSQYADRPLVCRRLYSLAVDEQPCRLEDGRQLVPYLNQTSQSAQNAVILGLGREYADIRDWFPSPA